MGSQGQRTLLNVAALASDPSSPLEEAKTLAATFGYVLGAASVCPRIEEVRFAVTADRAAELLRVYSGPECEPCAVIFERAFFDGEASMAAGEIDETTIEDALGRIENTLGR